MDVLNWLMWEILTMPIIECAVAFISGGLIAIFIMCILNRGDK